VYRNTLKVTVEGQTEVKLYPGEDEPINILNIKRGIVSALIVPVMEEEKNKEMVTFLIYLLEDIATEVTVDRDLSRCDWFFARRQDTSPLALISGMNYPLSKMISSTQTCNYQFDNQKKHMTSGTCTEKHIFLPLSYKNEYGISAVVRQTLNLRETAKINDRIFDRNEDNVKGLPLEVAEDKSAVQTKDAVITTMQTLSSLSQTNDREQRAGHFHKLVSELRALEADVLTSSTEEMMDISNPLTYQALAQCGTPACTSAMLKILSTFDAAALEVDAVVYALALLPNPSRLMVKDMLAMAQNRQSKPLMYALSNAARKLYKAEGLTPEITAVSEFMTSLLGADCAGEKELTFLTLRVVGNMGDAMEAADPAIKTTLLKCMRQPATTLSVQLAAIQAFRRMSVTDEVRSNLQRVSQYPKGAVQKRLAAYLMLMRTPQDSDIEMVKKLLTQEQNMQIKSFVTSHIYNIISSKASATKEISRKILDALQDTDIVPPSDFTTSRNYKLGMSKENMQANIQGNIIFDPSSQLPREVLLETTMEAFGFSMDIWEFGMEGKGLDPTIEALFGKNGFFPDTMSKALYWAEDKMQPKIREVLENKTNTISLFTKVPENIFREIARNINKLVRELQNQDSPEAMAYLRLMGVELGYIKSKDGIEIVHSSSCQAIANLISKTDNELFAHYIFMDNKFILPTASGMPLKFALAGTFTPGAKGGLRFSRSMNELVFMPSVGVEFRTQMGIYIPEFVVSGVDMQTSLYHESALNAKLTTDRNQIRLSIPAPQVLSDFFHSRYAFDIKPSRGVSEYTATIAYELLTEGEDQDQMVDSLRMTLKAEGIGTFLIEEISSIYVLNQASADSMVEVQLLVPSLRTDATVTATLTRVEGLKLEIKSDMKLSEVSSVQAVVFKYGMWGKERDNQAEVQLISNTNADTKIPLQYASALREWTPLFMEDVMNQRIPKTNKKIVVFSVFHPFNSDSTFRYKFNENRLAVTVPLPLGGKSSEELRVPAVVTLPYINMPQLGVEIAAQEIQVPTFTIPSEYDLTLPLMGMVEMSAKVNSNFYNLEATASAGNATEDSPNYQAKFNILGDSSIQLLSFSVEGNLKFMEFTLDSSLKHKLLNTGFSVLETITLTDNVLLTGNYKVYAASPVGLDTSLTATTQFTLDSNTLFGDLNTDGIVTLGPLTASTTYLHTFSAEPAKKEAKMESILRINSEILKIVNKMKASYENEELLFESNANLNSGPIRHTTKINLSYKDVKLAVQYDSVTKALERMVRSQLEFSASEGQASLRIENQADYAENRAYSLLTGSLSPSGLEINADASINLFSSLASHKATFTLTADGLTTSCTTTAQHIFSEEELKNTYEIKFVDMVLSATSNTNGKLLGGRLTHTTSAEVAGLTMKIDNVANFKCQSLRLDSTVKALVEPFALNIDAVFNSDGAVFLYGQQSGELYSKFLLKAEPLLFTQSFECRASTTHELEDNTIKTMMNNKFNSILSLQEQGFTLKVTSELNENTFNQEISAYNNVDRMGIELAGEVSAPIFSEIKEDYAISAFVKYDKNSDSHFIQIPFADRLPEVIESMKTAMMTLMETLKDFNSKFEISDRFQTKLVELKEVIDNFDFNLFTEDLKKFLGTVELMVPVQELLSFDIEQLIRDVQDYFMRVFQKIASFDYDTFTVELKDKVAEMSQIPCFGKLYGGFKVTSPHYNLITTADLENSTTTTVTPEFKMNFKSQAESTLKILDFNVDASATFTAPERSQLTFAENIKVDHSSFVLDHKGEMTIYGLTRTGYKHDINMPLFNIFSEAKLNQKTVLLLEDSGLRLTLNNVASEKLAVKEFSDEVKHNSDIVVVIDIQKIKLTFTGETGSNNLKMIQNVVADIGILRDIIFDAKFETETPFLKDSVAEVKFTADVRELKVDFTASHRAELTGQFEGTVSNSLLASVTPAEITFDTKNNGNAKVFLPFKLSGKIDLQNDIAFTLNSAVQQASWTGLARFNQYKYSHFLSFDNGESEINIVSQINGEANLDILKDADFPETATVPAFKVPLIGMDVSSFTIPLPHPTMISVPALHIPSALTKLTIPKITLPRNVNIRIPALGDLTYEFSLKTAVITLKTDASILTQDSINMKLDASSASEFRLFAGTIEGNSIVNMEDGLKITSDLSLKHRFLEGNHESTIVLGLNNLETSITNSMMSRFFGPTAKIQQEFTTNPEEGLVFSMFSPSAGQIALQMQTKSPAQVKARLYDRQSSRSLVMNRRCLAWRSIRQLVALLLMWLRRLSKRFLSISLQSLLESLIISRALNSPFLAPTPLSVEEKLLMTCQQLSGKSKIKSSSL
uniref:Vitellogenin domain-containing protein n=1 Tax=Salarias fasciatus TaxID=181472 RepID=A0A672H2F1_SALFA